MTMKTFFKYDYYFQLILLITISFAVKIGLLIGEEKLIYLFYFGVGISQLISYFIRSSYKYEKSILFKLYGFLIIPIFPCLLGLILFGNNNEIAAICIVIPALSLLYSPVMAVVYLYDNYKTYKKCQ